MWYLLLGLFLGFLSTMAAIRYFPQWGLLDFPERYHLKRPRKPYPGGLVLWGISLAILLYFGGNFLPVALGVLVIGLISFLDDRSPLPATFRLSVQILVAAFLWFEGIKITYISHPFLDTNVNIEALSPLLSFLFTLLWIVALQNALNWFDGAPGLAVGISGIGFLTLGILILIRPELFFDASQTPLWQIQFFLAGLSFGAFWFYWQGKIILGDTGSQVLGFLLATMAIFSGAKIATTLLVLSVPVLDFLWVIFRRLFLEHRSPFQGDTLHLHHLLMHFFSPKTVTLILVGFSALFGASALFLSGSKKLYSFLFLSALIWSLSFGLWHYLRQENPKLPR